jgi:hypothetical protein
VKVHLAQINRCIHLSFCFLLIPTDLIESVENERLQSTIWGCVICFSAGLISGLEKIQKRELFADWTGCFTV